MIAQEIQPLLRVFVAGKPCSVNRIYSTGRGRNHYSGRRRSDECLAWQAYVWAECKRTRVKTPHRPLRVEIEFFQLRSNSDPDNFIKATQDALADALGINDKQISTVTATRMPRVKGRTQGAMLTVWEASLDA